MKKTKGRVIVAIVMVLLLILSVWALKEREEYHRRLAEDNLNDWIRLSQDLSGINFWVDAIDNRMEIREDANYYYFIQDYGQVMPSMSGASRNLMPYYFRLVNELTAEQTELTEEEIEEGLRIFREMNKDLESLCQSVIERCYTYKYGVETGDNWKFRKELVEYGSDAHQEVSQEIEELSNQYVTELRAFFKEWIVVEH